MAVGTPKSIGDGHTMGETGLKAVAQGIQYLLGKQAVGVPTLRHLDPDLGPAAENVHPAGATLRWAIATAASCARPKDSAATTVQSPCARANAEAFARYSPDRKLLAAYLERWPELRREREQRERHWRLRRRSSIELAQLHRWKGLD